MPAPTPIDETYIPCVGLRALVGGVLAAITTGGFTPSVAVDEMTNNAGYGFYEDVQTIKKGMVKVTIAAKTTLTGLISGDIYPVLINCTTMPTVTAGIMAAPTPTVAGAPAFAGNCRLIMDNNDVLDVSKGVKYSFTGTTQGTFAYSI